MGNISKVAAILEKLQASQSGKERHLAGNEVIGKENGRRGSQICCNSKELSKKQEVKGQPELDEKFVMEVNEGHSSMASLFGAMKLVEEFGKLVIEAEKCKLCGICYSICPDKAISALYFD